MRVPDVIVVGSGPSGVHAAAVCAQRGLMVHIIDVGYDDAQTRDSIPPGDFESLRHTDPSQARYFVGDGTTEEALTGVRVGAQLTPPRQFITRNVDRLLPIESATFSAMQSLARGGLGAGWGAGTYSYSVRELEEIGLPVDDMRRQYAEVAAAIGISAPEADDISDELARYAPVQPPHELDTNAAALFETYKRRRERVRARGLSVGRAPAAILSRPLEYDGIVREPNPYEDMDFYSDASRSVYRPRFTLEGLVKKPNVTYAGGLLVRTFVVGPDSVDVHVSEAATGESRVVSGRRLILAAGAIGSSRIALRSLGLVDRPVPILSNPYTYLPCVNRAMFGRPAQNKRHSLAQLCGVYSEGPERDVAVLSFFSYRSLLLFKLIKEMPMPPVFGLLTARLLLSSLTIVGIHHFDRRTTTKTMTVGSDPAATMSIRYEAATAERVALASSLAKIRTALREMGLVPLSTISPGNGSSIHYAGAFAITTDRNDPLGTTVSGELHAAPRVYVGDSANWRSLPAKGLTMSLMANARRVAVAVCDGLR